MSDTVEHISLSKELQQFVEGLESDTVTFGALLDSIADRGFGLVLLVLALPAALPIPAPGYATPFGLMMAALAIQMMRGRTTPWFPERIRQRSLSKSKLDWTVRNAGFPLRFVEWVIRPRWSSLARNRFFLGLVGFIVMLMSLSMALPIPLTNTAPSFVIFVLAAGILEEDGFVLLGGILLAPLAAGIAGVALYFAWTHGLDAVEQHAKPMIKGLLGM
ncbi:MAG: exopolysaccharide biosynthesis protein [Myxococcota bacterium]